MKKIIFLISITFISLNSYSQINYEKGYFIDNKNNKTECYIKSIGWISNPTKIEYSLTEKGGKHTITINEIKEFRVAKHLYTRFSVKMDKSGQQMENYSYSRNPEYETKTLLLKQIVKGDANLYQYINHNYVAYFFNKKNETPIQLIHKKYKKSETEVGENNMFRQQLQNNLQCENISSNSLKNIAYTKARLLKLFTKYNSCNNLTYINKLETKNKNLFNLYARGGITMNPFKIPSRGITNPPSPNEFDFGTIIGLQIGIEAEYILAFNKNKWALILEPTFTSFSKESSSLNYYSDTVIFKSKTLELPLGLRHYFFLNNTSKIFLNVSYILVFDLNSKFTTIRSGFDFHRNTNIAFGIGYNYNTKISIEGRYQDKGNIFPNSTFNTDFSTFSILIGINIL